MSAYKGMGRYVLLYVVIAGVLAIFLFPFYWMAISGFRTPDTLFSSEPTLWPTEFSLEFYDRVMRGTSFWQYTLNSLYIAVASTALSLVVGTLGAYSVTRFDYFARRFVARTFLFIYMFPPILLVIPLFFIFKNLGLVDSYLGLILAYTTFSLPVILWLLSAFFRTIPEEIEEAGRVDGAGRMGVFFRIVLPLAAPGLAAASVFAFLTAWNEYLFASILINSNHLKTLPLGVAHYVSVESTKWGEAMSAATLLSIPVFLFAAVVQRYLVAGLTAGSVKG
ncbi:MAG: carbohydrate ABC transporter permease [Caldilineaceae bacterium]